MKTSDIWDALDRGDYIDPDTIRDLLLWIDAVPMMALHLLDTVYMETVTVEQSKAMDTITCWLNGFDESEYNPEAHVISEVSGVCIK